MDTDNIKITMKEDDSFDIIVNGELEVHIRCNDIGYSVDLYKHASQEDMEADDYNFDGDFIDGMLVYFDDIRDEVEDND